MDKASLIEELPELLKNLFEIDVESKNLFRSKIRHLLAKLIKKVGKDVMESSIPKEHVKFVKYIVKNEKMEVKKRKNQKLKMKAMFEELAEKKLKQREKKKDGMEEESENSEDENIKDNFGVQYIEDNKEDNNNLLLRYDLEQEKFHFTEHPLNKLKEKIKKEEEMKKVKDLEILKGKIVVREVKNHLILGCSFFLKFISLKYIF